MYKTKVPSEEKIKAVEAYLGGSGSSKSWSKKYGVQHSTFQKWVHVYETFGPEGLMEKSKASRYSADTKQSAVEAYLSGAGSQSDLCKRFGILSRTQLQNWTKLYNGHKELRSTGGSRSELYMTKGCRSGFADSFFLYSKSTRPICGRKDAYIWEYFSFLNK